MSANLQMSIGYWMSDKKVQKLNMNSLKQLCKESGYNLVKLDLGKSLEQQGPFCVIFHKCTDIILKANAGDDKSAKMMKRLEDYLILHPEVPIVDPLDKLHAVLNRYRSYLTTRNNPRLKTCSVFTPTAVELTSSDPLVNLATLKSAGVRFPFVCKPSVAHGCEAHEMAIIFNEEGVRDCRPPSVAQSFVNHNALLYKVYCVGSQYVTVERPSLKNFYSYANQQTIFFSSADVSKSDSTSSLTMLDADDPMLGVQSNPLDSSRLDLIVDIIRQDIGLALMGIDIVIDNATGLYAVIDINAFPGYDGYPDLWRSVMSCLESAMANHLPRNASVISASSTGDHDDSGFDTSDSSDERKRQLNFKPCC